MKEDYALDEMEIAENGPNLPNADKILASVMDKYWQAKLKAVIGISATKQRMLEHTLAQAKLWID